MGWAAAGGTTFNKDCPDDECSSDEDCEGDGGENKAVDIFETEEN